MHSGSRRILRNSALTALLGMLLFAAPLRADHPDQTLVELNAVLGTKALLSVNGEQVMLAAGQSRKGVHLLAVDQGGGSVRVRVDGSEHRIGFGSSVGTHFSEPEASEARIYRDSMGMYQAVGTINGAPVVFLVDTGATFVGIDDETARRAGIRYRSTGQREVVHTANGEVVAYRVKLDAVSLGSITLRYVDAHVLENSGLRRPLLGMSFLGRVQVRNDADAMVLRQQH